MSRLGDFGSEDFLEGVDALARRIEGVHEMHPALEMVSSLVCSQNMPFCRSHRIFYLARLCRIRRNRVSRETVDRPRPKCLARNFFSRTLTCDSLDPSTALHLAPFPAVSRSQCLHVLEIRTRDSCECRPSPPRTFFHVNASLCGDDNISWPRSTTLTLVAARCWLIFSL